MESKGYLKQYMDFHTTYRAKYGPNTVVLMMKGKFYEVNAVINDTMNVGPDIYEIGELLRFHVTRQNTKIREVSYKNTLLIGIPVDFFHKHCGALLNGGYTVIQVDQVTSLPNIEREVVAVHSPGTILESTRVGDSNYLASVYLDSYHTTQYQRVVCVGFSVVDVGTGTNYVHRVQGTEDEDRWSHEVFRLLHTYQPSELLVHLDEGQGIDVSELCQKWSFPLAKTHLNPVSSEHFRKPSFQNEFYRKIYPECGLLTPVEAMGLERYPEVILSHIYMMQFIYEHRVENITLLQKPLWVESEDHLSLSHNAMYQLNLIDTDQNSDTYRSLLSLLNTCKTALGRRLCKMRLLNPIVNSKCLEDRYAQVESFQARVTEDTYLYERCRTHLGKIRDLERLYRKMSLGLMHPYEFYSLHQSYMYLERLVSEIEPVLPDYLEPYRSMRHELQMFRDTYEALFDLPEMESSSLNDMKVPIFLRGVCSDIDGFQERIQTHYRHLRGVAKNLSFYIDAKHPESVKLVETDKYGHALTMTAKRSTTLKTRLRNLPSRTIEFKDGDTIFLKVETQVIIDALRTRGGKDVYLTLPWVDTLSHEIIALQKKVGALNKGRYIDCLREFYRDTHSLFDKTVQFIATTDVYASVAKSAKESYYCRPTVLPGQQSSVQALGLRHPLVEKIQRDIAYVPNDVSLDQSGILLYGTNACGKSTLMKSLGLALVMAQAGFFVPCSSFSFTPYTQIFTRILNNDNIFKGQSTFATEMNELRGILKRANDRSLVLGDELCAGTEHTSAISIVAAGLKTLSDKRSAFVFTSHLHALPEVSMVKELPNLSIFHLKIIHDPETDRLIYDRTLVPGSGPPIYGLVVANAMGLGDSFISLARHVQQEIMGESKTFVKDTPSHYHKDLMMDGCHVCHAPSTETHHIAEQHTANADGQIEHFHKHSKHNLVPLCESCHHEVHHGSLQIHGYQQTDQGIRLEFVRGPTVTPNSRKKYTDNDIQQVLTYQTRIRDKQLTKTQCIRNLELNHGLTISSSTLTKILTGTY